MQITIHALPHTHLDAGWIETFDMYYHTLVVDIFKTLIPALEQNPTYRFNWAEVGYLEKWWSNQEPSMRDRFKRLVDRKQIQFVGGGWVQHDEASVEYYNVLEQLEAGWLFLKKVFNVRPHVGWQLDPFGYSAVTPTVLAKYGVDTLFITRVGESIKQKLREQGHL
jgi:lysosomal alpha-mannosidase